MIKPLIILIAGLLGRFGVAEVERYHADPRGVEAAVDSLVAATPTDELPALLERADSAYFTPGEPTECEALMALYLRAAMPRLEDTDLDVALWKLHEVCEVNAPDSLAADFKFRLPGVRGEVALSRYLPGKPLLLFFYDPDCRHCLQTISELRRLNIAHSINVLAVCVDSTPTRWEETRAGLPQGWTAAFDCSGVTENDTYVIRSLPSIYLLDGDRRVVLKNPQIPLLLSRLP